MADNDTEENAESSKTDDEAMAAEGAAVAEGDGDDEGTSDDDKLAAEGLSFTDAHSTATIAWGQERTPYPNGAQSKTAAKNALMATQPNCSRPIRKPGMRKPP